MLVGRHAPYFKAAAVMEDNSINNEFSLENYLEKSYCILFFYPLDFTFVCPTEIISFNNRIEEFSSRNTKVVGISVDSCYTHLAWKNTPVEKGGIGNIQYPLVSDLDKSIARSYDVLIDCEIALRATFLIDMNGVVKHSTINDTSIGRNIDEMIRLVDALQYHEKNGEVCPAGWIKGKKAMKPDSNSVAEYLSKNAKDLK